MTSLLFFASSTLSPCSVPPLYNLIEVRKGRKEGGRDGEGERGRWKKRERVKKEIDTHREIERREEGHTLESKSNKID